MIITELTGGLGNQMFQYAFGRYISYLNETPLKICYRVNKNFPRQYELFYFQIIENFASKLEIFKLKGLNKTSLLNKIVNRFIFHKNLLLQKKYYYDKSILESCLNSKNIYLKGYWQSKNYFKGIEEIIKKEFTLKNRFIKYKLPEKSKILKTNSVSVHIRRGDYLSPSSLQNLGLCSLKYYEAAIAYIKSKEKNPVFFIFSDDIKWVKTNLNIDLSLYYIENNPGYLDMHLMSLCKHNIIANSSFSWWGAWLNNNQEKIVIAPKKWFFKKERENETPVLKNWIKL